MPSAPIRLDLVVPCLNEGTRLDALLEAIRAWREEHADRYHARTVFVDDGSTDDTLPRLETAARREPWIRVLRSSHNEGKGAALRRGIADADEGSEFVVALDADLAVGLDHLAPLLSALEGGAEIAVGSRNVAGGRIVERQRLLRRWLGRGYLIASRWMLGLDVHDVTCGFKGYRTALARRLFAATRCRRWGIDAEMLFLARRLGLGVVEVPVAWSDGRRSAVRLYRDVLGSLRELLAVRLRALWPWGLPARVAAEDAAAPADAVPSRTS